MMHENMTLAGGGVLSLFGIPLESAGIALALFVAGLVGSFSHCAGMCGPFVLAQSTTNSARKETADSSTRPGALFSRLGGAALLPYHLGRATTYAALGAAAASLTGALMMVPELRWLAIAFLGIAGVAFLSHALGGLPTALKRHLPGRHLGARWAALVSRLARPLFASPRGWRGYFLG
ncbi:MAG: sulfite exporter TauE/SafE family protein, partial [Rhodospirillaceae bacterium]|nr:sulfite exporter TauE/SafE family protein [Rhodospirillaceae bacterium]